MILDLIGSLTEKNLPIKTQSKESLGDLLLFGNSIILPDYSQESSWRVFFPKRKIKLIHNLLSQIGKTYLKRSKLLACWNQLGDPD